MYDRLFAPLYRFKSALQKFFPALGQNLHDHVVWNQFSVYKLAQKIKFNLTCSREADLYFLKTEFNQIIKKLYFFGHDHGINQRLIAVAQIHAAPDGRLFNLLVGPLPLGVIHHRVSAVSLII